MRSTLHIPLCLVPVLRSRLYSTLRKTRRLPNESTLAGAQHKPSLSGPSLGHLFSELSATTPQMLRDGVRVKGETMEEEHRTKARRVTLGLMGLPVGVGVAWVGWEWLGRGASARNVGS